jgi:hypothetical protein
MIVWLSAEAGAGGAGFGRNSLFGFAGVANNRKTAIEIANSLVFIAVTPKIEV